MAQVTNNRIRRKPVRYGDGVCNSSAHSEENELYADNSFDDETYAPNVGARICSVNMEPSNDARSVSNDSICFDNEFEQIELVNKSQSNGHLTVSHETGLQTIQNALQVRHNSGNESTDLNHVESPSENGTTFQLKVLEQLQILSDSTIQILARIVAIEECLLKNGTLISVQTGSVKREQSHLEEFHSFAEKKQLPFKTVEDFKAFESSLDDKSMEEAVSWNHF